MVDINLLGDDKTQNENDFDNEEYSSNYDTESKEFGNESDLVDSDIGRGFYERSYSKSSSRKTTFIIAAVVVAISIVVTVYIMVNSSKNKIKESESKSLASPSDITTDTSAMDSLMKKPIVEIPLFAKEMISSTQHGIKTVETLLTTIPKDVNFTMIQYRDGNFLTELLGKSSNSLTNLNDQMQQRLASGNVKVLSRDKKNVRGAIYQQALMNGNVVLNQEQIFDAPSYLEINDVKIEFTDYCKQFGLSLKQFDVKNEIRADGYKKVPVIFRAVGSRDSALNLLNKIIEKNINVNLSKIVLLALDNDFEGGKITIVLNMEIYYAT